MKGRRPHSVGLPEKPCGGVGMAWKSVSNPAFFTRRPFDASRSGMRHCVWHAVCCVTLTSVNKTCIDSILVQILMKGTDLVMDTAAGATGSVGWVFAGM